MMRFKTKTAKKMGKVLHHLSEMSGIDGRGVSVTMSDRYEQPSQRAGVVRLPAWIAHEPSLLAQSFLHELQHARDVLDGMEQHFTIDQMEERAQAAEKAIPLQQLQRLYDHYWKLKT